jgi:uncharacterized protein YjbI with pentapeptide repeats
MTRPNRLRPVLLCPLLVLALLLALGACSEVAPTNPYDPSTPEAQQAKGLVRGRVVLAAPYTAEVFEGSVVTLSRAATPESTAFETTPAPEGDAPEAAFTVVDVPAGLYWLRVQLTGFARMERLIEVTRGGEADVGTLSPDADVRSALQGVARLDGPGVEQHEGIVVTALGTPFAALTAADGAFRMELSEGTFTLRASHAGYTSAERAGVTVAAGGVTPLDEPLTLVAAPGAVHLTVRLEGATDMARQVIGVSVAVAPAAGGEAVLAAQPDAQGNVLLAPVPAGAYVVSATLAGFGTDTRQVAVAPAQTAEVGTITLRAANDATITGTALLRGPAVQSHQGILITVDDLAATALTDETGAFRLPVNLGTHTLRARFPGYDAAESEPIAVEQAGEVALNKPLELEPRPGAVRVRVQPEPDFRALALDLTAASVELTAAEDGTLVALGTPDAAGDALLANVTPGRYRLTATLPGFLPAERLLDVAPAATADAGNLVLFAALDGLVTGTARLAGAADHSGIAVSSNRVPGVVFTDAAGGFRLPVIAETHTLTFRRAGYAVAQRADVVVAAGQEVALPEAVVLEGDPGALTGTVALQAGFDGPDARQAVDVAVFRADAADDAAPLAQTRPSAEGRYLLDGLGAGRYRVRFSSAGFAVEVREADVPVGATVAVPHVTLFAPGDNLVLSGRAEFEGAASHSGIRVEIGGTAYFTETTADGAWQIQCVADLVAGRTVAFTAPGYSPVTLPLPPLLSPPAHALADVARLLGEPGSLRGRVRIDERFAGDDLMPQVVLTLSHFEGDRIVEDRVEAPTAEGVFHFEDLPAGSYLLEARLANFVTAHTAAVVGLGTQAEVGELLLSPDDANRRGVLAGRVRLAGRPDGEHGGIRVETARSPYVTFTGADGQFELDALGGVYAVEFRFAGYGLERLPAVEIPAQGRNELAADILLSGQPGRVLGTISLPAGFDDDARMVAVQVAVFDAAGEIVLSRSPAVSGDFVLGPLPAGEYTFEASLAGFRTERLPFTLGPGESVDVRQIAMSPEPVSPELAPRIAGRVEREGAAAGEHGGIRVEVQGTPYVAVTNSDGRFEVTTLPEATRLRFGADRYGPEERGPFDMAAVRVRDLELDPQVGVVTLHGEPGRVRGVVALPAGFDAARFAQVAVRARQGADVVAQVAPDGAGTFVIPALPAGAYTISVVLAGADALDVPVAVEVGETTDLGRLALTVTRLEAAVSGTARLQGVVDVRGHGGIRVESQGTPFTTVTTEAGQFTLDVTPGPHTLVFSYPGYGRQTVAAGQVPAGPPALALGAEVVLPAQPGAISGSVALARYGTVARLQGADVEILNGANARVALVHPAADGRFSAPDIAAGAYTVRVAAVGYSTQARAVVVPVGGAVAVGHFDLAHKSTTPDAVAFAGRVRVGDGRELSGTQVRVRLANPDQAFATVTTDAEGRFELLVAPDESHRVTVHRPGYIDPVLNTNWRWDAVDARVENEQSQAFDISLVPAPLDGRVTVTVRITPDWIPLPQQWVRATLRSETFEATLPQVTEAAAAVFSQVPAGRYVLSLERPGFTSVQVPLTVDFEHQQIVVPTVDVRLTSLVSAQIDLIGETLAACDLRRSAVEFRGGNFSGATLTGDFSAAGGAACAGCVQCGAFDFESVDFTNADLTQVTSFAGVNLENADLFGADFYDPAVGARTLRGANLRFANLFGADLERAILARADLTGANLTSARAARAVFTEAGEASPAVPCAAGGARPAVVLTGANFAQTDLTGATLRGVNLEGAALGSALLASADLSFACLRGASLTLTDLSQTRLDRADLSTAALTSSILNGTIARGAQFTDASLTDAVIEGADFSLLPPAANQTCNPYPFAGAAGTRYDDRCVGDARFTDARCCRTEFDRANLNGANLVGAVFDGADLIDASLLGLTMGPIERRPTLQPSACQPELAGACASICARHNEFLTSVGQGELDCELFAIECLGGTLYLGTPGVDLRLRENDAPGLTQCIAGGLAVAPGTAQYGLTRESCSENVNAFPPAPGRCTWQKISNPAQFGACADDDIPDACLLTYTSVRNARLSNARMTALVLNAADTAGAILDGANLRGLAVYDAYMSGTSLVGADLSQSDLAYSTFLNDLDLTNALFNRSQLTQASLVGSTLTGARLIETDLRGADLSSVSASAPNGDAVGPVQFVRADLTEADFYRAVLPGAQFSNLPLDGADFGRSALVGAHFDDVRGADLQFECVDLTGGQFTNTSLSGTSFERTELAGAEFLLAAVSGARFTGSNLAGARIRNGDWSNTSFNGRADCPFDNAAFENTFCGDGGGLPPEDCTSMRGAFIEDANLAGARLGGDFTNATIRTRGGNGGGSGTSLSGGDFTNAAFYGVQFSHSDYDPIVGYDALQFRESWNDTDLDNACPFKTNFVHIDFRGGNSLNGLRIDAAHPPCQRACTFENGDPHPDCLTALDQCDGPPPGPGFGFPTCARMLSVEFANETANDWDLPHIEITDSDFTNSVLQRAALPYLEANNTDFTGTDFIDSNLDDAELHGNTFINAVFRRTSLLRADFTSSNLGSVDFFGANLTGANLTVCAPNAQFNDDGVTRTNLTNAVFDDFARADLASANFTNATMTGARLNAAWMPSAVLTGATANNAQFLRANLSGAMMRNMNLSGADLRACNFQSATWGGSNFSGATLCDTDYTWLTAVGANRCVGCTNLAATIRVACALNCPAYADPCP